MINKDKIIQLVINVIEETVKENENINQVSINLDTPVYGKNGFIDSLSLVRIVAEIEERIYSEFSVEILLADDKAMSQKISPFRSVRSLSEYIYILINPL